MPEPRRTVSPERQAVFYVGVALSVIGFLTFGSVFVSGAMHFGDFSDFEDRSRNEMLRSVIGMAMMIGGAVTAAVGRNGLAGSGVVLDPQRARQDLEPFNRAAGGMLNDALDEVDAVKNLTHAAPSAQAVKVRCRDCQALNDEQARFCNQCGKEL